MPALADIVLTMQGKDALVSDCVQLVENRVARRGGLRGITLKTGLAVIKAARPDIVQRAVRRLLPEFVASLEPLYQELSGLGRNRFRAISAASCSAIPTAHCAGPAQRHRRARRACP